MATAPEKVDLVYIFARDMVNVLVRLKVKDFQLEDTNHDHPTPFCFRIRRAVEHFLTLEHLDIYFNATDLRAVKPKFKDVLLYQRETVAPRIRSLMGLLKQMALICMQAAWYCKWGEETAPLDALEEIKLLLVNCLSKYDDPDIFWNRLRVAAPFITNRPLTDSERIINSNLFL